MGSHSKGFLKDVHHLPLIAKLFDSILIYSSLYIMSLFIRDIEWIPNYNLLALISILVFIFAAESAKLYQSWRGVEFVTLLKRVLIVWAATSLMLIMIGYLTKVTSEFSRILITSWFFVVPILLLTWRAAYKSFIGLMRSKGYNSRKVAIVGISDLGVKVARHIEDHEELGMALEGLYDDRGLNRDDISEQDEFGGCSDTLVDKVHKGELDIIYITLPLQADERIKDLIDKLSDTTVAVYMLPDLYTFNLFNGSWTDIGGHPMVSVFETPFMGVDAFFKRVQDVTLSAIILTLISPLLLGIVIAVRMTSKGPALFKQCRYGISGNKIPVWKFRSMTTVDNGDEIKQATKDDARITPLGSFLRRTSLDELPQFFNVLTGTMSIVGPRPHAIAHNELYRKQIRGYMMRHAVKPGITGWAQINGYRGETDTVEKMQHRIDFDHWYISHWSIWLDLKIIFLTIFKGFVSKNAY